MAQSSKRRKTSKTPSKPALRFFAYHADDPGSMGNGFGGSDAPGSLIMASEIGDLIVVKALLAGGADVNAKDEDGMTALIMASQNGHLEVVKALLANGADVNAKSGNGFAAWIVATQNAHLEVVMALLAAPGLKKHSYHAVVRSS